MGRVLIYSTDASYQHAFAQYPQARLFESRDRTRDRLANVALAHNCQSAPEAGSWVAFEYQRKVELVETFTLGEARSPVNAKLWTRPAIDCFQSRGKVHILAIGINTQDDYRAAACRKIDAVLVDSPRAMRGVKQQLEADAQRLGGLRLLPGRFMVIQQAMGTPKGRGAAAQAALAQFVEDMKASGFVAEALARHGIQGASVAPAAAL